MRLEFCYFLDFSYPHISVPQWPISHVISTPTKDVFPSLGLHEGFLISCAFKLCPILQAPLGLGMTVKSYPQPLLL